MLTLYRGHWLLLLCDRAWWCEITEIATREILPTAVTAELAEGPDACIDRAKALVDRYADGMARRAENLRSAGAGAVTDLAPHPQIEC